MIGGFQYITFSRAAYEIMHLAGRGFIPGPDTPNQVWIHSLPLSLIPTPYTTLVLLHNNAREREGPPPNEYSKYAAPSASLIIHEILLLII